MKLIVGLGNPDRDYVDTRHNVGFVVVETLAALLETDFRSNKVLEARIAQTKIGGEKVILLEPQTFMNLSGKAVQAAVSFYKIPVENIVIVHDEMDYPVGRIAFLKSGGAGGHNGVASVQERLGTQALVRLRIGIGRPTPPLKSENFVLQKFSSTEEKLVQEAVDKAAKALLDWLSEGLTKTMNSWNGV